MKSKHGVLVWCVAVMTVLSLATLSCQARPAATGPIRWKAQSTTGATTFAYLYAGKPFVEAVNEQSKGALTIELFPAGSVVGPTEQMTAVSKGSLQVGLGLPGSDTKVIPEGNIQQGLPGTLASTDDVFDFVMKYKGGAFHQLLAEAYREQGLHLLQAAAPWDQVIISSQPIRSVNDLKGKKMRAPGAFGQLVTALGAAPVNIVTAETFMALQNRTIDATINADYMIGTANFWDAAKYMILPSFGPANMNLYVNQKAYDALPKELKKVVDDAAVKASTVYLAASKEQTSGILSKAVKEKGVEIITLPADEYAKVRKAAEPILDKEAAASPRSAKLVGLIKEYLAGKK